MRAVESMLRGQVEDGHIQLCLWAVFHLKLPDRQSPTLHVVGANLRTGRSRISSAITLIDASRLRVGTESGRVYDLLGEPCRGDLAAAVFARLTADWGATMVADVTRWLLGATDAAFVH